MRWEEHATPCQVEGQAPTGEIIESCTYRKSKNFAVEIFSLYSRAPLHRENNSLQIVHHVIFSNPEIGDRFAMELF